MSQPRKLDKKLCLDKSKQKSFVLKGKRKSSSMQSFTEKVGFDGGIGNDISCLFACLFVCDLGTKSDVQVVIACSVFVSYLLYVYLP